MVGPAVVVIGHREHFTPLLYVETYLTHALTDIGAAAFFLLIYERAFVGIAREVAPQLPPDFRGHALLSGVRRLIVLSSSITLTVGIQAAGLARSYPWEHRIGAVVLVTVGLVTTYVGALVALASSSVTTRVRRLADALNRVGSGGAATRLMPESGDELDRVGRAFNTMVDLLEAHGEDLRASRARLVDVADTTRRSIERDLHDGAQQSLALVSMQLGQLERRCASDPSSAARDAQLRAELIAVARELRRLAHGIYPASLEAEGLPSALRAMARGSGRPVDVAIALEERWPREIETAVYFAIWEAVQRAQQDDVADRVTTVRIGAEGATAVVDIALVPDLTASAAGDLTVFLQDRLGAVGGTLAHVAAPGHGRYLGRLAVR
jgi:signal transduction histidine kinase